MGVSEFLLPYTDALFLFIWYSVQFVFMCFAIVYMSKTLNWPARFWAVSSEQQAQQQATVSPVATATSLITDAAQIAKTLKETLNTQTK